MSDTKIDAAPSFDSAPSFMDELLKQKLQTREGTQKLAEYGAAYLRDRAIELLRKGTITDNDKRMFDRLVDIMQGCAKHLQEEPAV